MSGAINDCGQSEFWRQIDHSFVVKALQDRGGFDADQPSHRRWSRGEGL